MLEHPILRRALLGTATAIIFIAAYILLVGAITFADVVVFELADPKMRGWRAWLQVIWPLWVVFFSPAAVGALLACWYSKLPLRGAAALLGVFLALTLVVIEVVWVALHLTPIARIGVGGGRFGLSLLLGASVVLIGAFFVIARAYRHRAVPCL
jgi:hypothetical protein